jgi:hypothetical protein
MPWQSLSPNRIGAQPVSLAQRSEVKPDGLLWLGAAYQHIADVWRIDRLWLVADGARDQC